MDNTSLPPDKVVIITRIEYLIFNLNNDRDMISKTIYQLIDEHNIAEITDIMIYLYEMLLFRGYAEFAEEFAKKYAISRQENG
jgi:hypothetical protein